MHLSEHAIRRPVTVLVVTAALLMLGAVSVSRLKLDFLPKMDMPFIGVYAPYPNAVPAQVEKEIARPIEEIMATLGNTREIFSESDEDGAFVGVLFEFGRSVDVLRMEVKEKLEQVRPLLPSDLRDTFIFTFNTNDIPIMVGRISAPGTDLAGSYELLERRVINPLQRVEGVGRVQVDGIAPKSIRIYLLLNKIIEHSIDVSRLFELLNANNLDLSVGQVRHGRQRVTVRALGQFRSLEDIENLLVSEAGLRLGDIAEIDYSEPAPSYYRNLNGESAIAFEIQKASGANIVEVSRSVHDVLAEIGRDPALAGINVVLFFDQAAEIKNSLKSVLQAGVIGSLLAIAVLFLFLRRVRTTLIISVAIPISVISACVFLFLTGRSLNILTMMALMLAVGMLVDNAIVVLESIYRRHEKGEVGPQAAHLGTREVAMAVTASTLTSIIVFAPIILTKGDAMSVWLGEVGLTISMTLIFSLLICLTLVPLLASRMPVTGQQQEGRWLQSLRRRYLRVLQWTAIRHPKRTGFVFIPLFLVVTVAAIQISGFQPEEMEGSGVRQERLYLWLEFSDNTNIYGVRDYVEKIESFLLPRRDSLGVESLYTFYRDNLAGFSLYFPKESPFSDSAVRELRQYLREELPVLPGIKYRFGDDEDAGRGARTISVTLFGEDTELLEGFAEEVQRRLNLLGGLEDVRTDIDEGSDEVRVILDRVQGGRYGVDSRQLAQILGLTFRGVPLREFQSADREIDMDIVLEPSDRRNIDNLAKLPISYREARPIRLGQVARFEIAKGPQRIHREQQKTAIGIRGSYEGEEYPQMIDQVTSMMTSLELPTGYSWSFGRELREARREQNDMGINILLALCCVYLLMAALFESFLHPMVIMLCIPFAALGVVWTLMLTGTQFNLMAMIGVVILIGIVVNNGIVLLDHVNNLRRRGYDRTTAIMEGCRDRFRPILMTAATTILGLSPLALGKADVSGGYYFPLARAVMGGLATSTVLTLLVLPTFYVLAESTMAKVKRTLAWGLGRAGLPWKEELPGASAGR
ncbi:MAG: efflux RND transporter permease subunit [Candidatus Eisenbacteria sp.]|nr:efflux RND transporter permease subunit [Candidatus Eisenbacteria bacterium]